MKKKRKERRKKKGGERGFLGVTAMERMPNFSNGFAWIYVPVSSLVEGQFMQNVL